MKRHNLFILCNLLTILWFKTVEGIVNGKDAAPGSFKYMVSVRLDSLHVCGGTIVGYQHVLTAAHCVIDFENRFKNQRLSIRGGVIDLNAPVTSGFVRYVIKIFIPKEYERIKPTSQFTEFVNEVGDLAILKTDNTLPIDDIVISMAKLPARKSRKYFVNYLNEKGTIIGFGTDTYLRGVKRDRSNNIIQRQGESSLKFAEAKVIHKNACKNMFSIPLTDKHLCAQILQKEGSFAGACNGDNGGPLMANEGIIIGVLSQNRENCNEQSGASLYTKVSSYIPWINKIIEGKPMSDARIAEYQLIDLANRFSEGGVWVIVQ